MELNLEHLRDTGFYHKHATNPPLSRKDPRSSLGDRICIVSFTTSGYM
jgi:hypothetical protein